jgi:GT2 family glycosyltransferase
VLPQVKHVKHRVILCTYNRPEEIRILLRNLSNQTILPNEIVIVEAGDLENSVRDSQELQLLQEQQLKVTVLGSIPGLTTQRNCGLEFQGDFDVVTFLDDDIVLPRDYLERVENIFGSNVDVVGVGGIDQNQPNQKASLLDRFFLLDARRPGKLLKSGVNVPFMNYPEGQSVDWLPGCSMSYKYSSLEGLKFDQTRQGVGWGEDVDFSVRAKRFGKLVMFRDSGILHSQSIKNRDSESKRFQKEIESRIKLIQTGHVRMAAILWSYFGLLLKRIFLQNFRKYRSLLVVQSQDFRSILKHIIQIIRNYWKSSLHDLIQVRHVVFSNLLGLVGSARSILIIARNMIISILRTQFFLLITARNLSKSLAKAIYFSARTMVSFFMSLLRGNTRFLWHTFQEISRDFHLIATAISFGIKYHRKKDD